MGSDTLVRFYFLCFFLGVSQVRLLGPLLEEARHVFGDLVRRRSGAVVELRPDFEVWIVVKFISEANHYLRLVLILRRDISIRADGRPYQ